MDREGFRNRLNQYKKAREENPGLKYYDFMERIAEFKAKEWNDDPDMVLQHMLNDNSYNYQQMYENNPNFDIQEGHFVDTYKTAYHPTFSEESMYSGKKSQYNPEGIVGGSWDESTRSFYLNDKRQSKRKAQDYLNHADPGYTAIPKYAGGGEVGKEYYNEVSTEDNPIYYKEQTAKEKYSDFVNRYGWTNIDALNARNAEASKYTIPYIPEKEIRLTTDRYNTGKISTNLLDSIYDSSQRVGIPFDVALGLAGRESTLGIGRGFKKGSNITMTDLYSNWQQVQPVIASKSMTDKWNDLVRKEKRGEPLTDDDYAFRTEFLKFEKRALESTKPIKEHPIDNALKLYLTGRYNTGDKSYEQKVQKDAQLVMSDPAIQKWAKEKGIALAEGGKVEPDPLEVLERSRPKVAGIPINDKPLSGTDPIGELYLNLVSGNAVRKAIKRGIDGMVRKSFYDNYKELLKAGWNRQRAYDYASPELAIDVLPGIAKGFDYVIKGANYTHAAKDFIE